MKNLNIDTIIHYPIPPHLQDAYKHLNYKNGDFPIAEYLAKHIISIPICPSLTEKQVNHVINSIKQYNTIIIQENDK